VNHSGRNVLHFLGNYSTGVLGDLEYTDVASKLKKNEKEIKARSLIRITHSDFLLLQNFLQNIRIEQKKIPFNTRYIKNSKTSICS
jgi:hypothetical protein